VIGHQQKAHGGGEKYVFTKQQHGNSTLFRNTL
jgi:hypothetical protein